MQKRIDWEENKFRGKSTPRYPQQALKNINTFIKRLENDEGQYGFYKTSTLKDVENTIIESLKQPISAEFKEYCKEFLENITNLINARQKKYN